MSGLRDYMSSLEYEYLRIWAMSRGFTDINRYAKKTAKEMRMSGEVGSVVKLMKEHVRQHQKEIEALIASFGTTPVPPKQEDQTKQQ